MMETTTSSAFAHEQSSRRIEVPFVSCDVPFEIARLRAERAYAQEGHAGRTLTKHPDLRVVLETMETGARLPFHETPERVTLQVILGQLRVWMTGGEDFDLAEGCFAAIDAGRVLEIESLRECSFLLTLAWPPVGRGAGLAGEGEGSGI